MAGETLKTEAVCLRIYPWSRTSHIVHWLTPHGRLATVVKGATRPKSAFLGQYDLNYTCEIVYYLGSRGDLHALRECSPENARASLRGNLAALLLADLAQNEGQRGDRGKEGTKDLRHEGILGGKLAEAHELIDAHDSAFDKAAFDLEYVLVLLGKLADDTGRRDGIAGGAREGSGAVEKLVELVVAGVVGGEPGQRILHDGVFHTSLTELAAQLRILSDIDTLVIDEDGRSRVLQLIGQGTHDCLVAFENLCIGHVVLSPPKNKCPHAKAHEDTETVGTIV